jgi:beta-glucanase (GH16 family)
MTGSVLVRHRIALPQIHRRNKKSKALHAVAHVIYQRSLSTGLTVVPLIAGAALIALSFGIHIPSLSNTSTNTLIGHSIPSKSGTAIMLPTIDACSPSQSQDNPHFAACPSFLLDYSGKEKGIASNNAFNIYTGPPIANNEAEYYTNDSSNVRIANGSLVLQANNQPSHGYSYTSARIDTKGKENFLYGKIVTRAIVPAGAGTWPAIWMLASQPKYASQGPANNTNRYANDGEIDIAESIGLQPHVVYGVAHSLAYPENGADRSYYSTATILGNDATFHDYELDWTPTSLTFAIDSNPYFTYNKKQGADWHSWPFDQPFYLVINFALGGSWAGADTSHFPDGGVDKQALPTALRVQSIHYYSYTGK